jgi:membrane protease YdiL (CAAX protease family)
VVKIRIDGLTGVLVKNNKSVFFFFGLVFLLSIPFWVLDFIHPVELLPGLPISALAAFVPALAACILVYKNNRLGGILQLLRRSFDFKRISNKYWYLAIIFINPAIALLAYWLMRASGKNLPNPAPLTLAVVPMFIVFVIAALGEEIGWSDYATDQFLSTWKIIPIGILIGVVWAVWHFIPLLQAHRSMEWIAWWSLGTVSLRVIMVWIYSQSGRSVFGMALFHTMINLCWQLFPINGSYYDPFVFGLLAFGVAIIIIAIQQFQNKG